MFGHIVRERPRDDEKLIDEISSSLIRREPLSTWIDKLAALNANFYYGLYRLLTILVASDYTIEMLNDLVSAYKQLNVDRIEESIAAKLFWEHIERNRSVGENTHIASLSRLLSPSCAIHQKCIELIKSQESNRWLIYLIHNKDMLMIEFLIANGAPKNFIYEHAASIYNGMTLIQACREAKFDEGFELFSLFDKELIDDIEPRTDSYQFRM